MTNNRNPNNLQRREVQQKSQDIDVVRATVIDTIPEIHSVRVNPRGDNAPFIAPVVTPMYGSQTLPNVGERVMVLFLTATSGIVLGSVYLTDGDDTPNIDIGSIRIGNDTGSHVTINSEGGVTIGTATGDFVVDGNKIEKDKYSDEDAQDAIGKTLSSKFIYDDTTNSIDLSFDPATQVELDNHSASASAHHTRYSDEEVQDVVDALVAGGTNVNTTYDDTGNTLTIDTSALNQEEVQDEVASLLSAGANITLSYSDSTDTLTLDTSALNQEQVEDTIGNVIQGGTGITATYDDTAGTVTIDGHTRYTDAEVLSTVGDNTNDVNIGVEDTRDTNESPTFFDKELSFDFKRTSTISVPSSGRYCGVMTFAPWSDNSGDQSHQVAFTNDGMFRRSAFPDSSTWGSWTRIGNEDKIFLAEGSTTNINQTATVSWTNTTFSDNAYSWNGSSQLTIDKAGRYEIHAEADFASTNASRQNPNLFINKNSNIVGVGGRSGYMRDAEGHNHSSVHAHAVIDANSGDIIDVTSEAEADTAGSIIPDRAMFYVKRVQKGDTDTPTLGYFDSNLVTTQTNAENGIYVNFAESINENDGWTVDSSSQISPDESGKYKIEGKVNFHRTGSGARNIMYAELELNGTKLSQRTRGVCYIRNNGNGDEGDADFSTIISLNAGDNLRLFANEERGAETGNDIERANMSINKIQ